MKSGSIKVVDQFARIDSTKIQTFDDFPLSEKTADGLAKANFVKPTKIQLESIGLALQGHDILGAAKTGSGKTLAFIIPILENLYCQKWTPGDGLGALIISPTRELAYQIFEVLRKIGKFHDFSAGLVIGGKHVREESDRINQTNIVICTPGRLLQHMDQTVYFNADNLRLLVLDEADRILDLGFQKTMNAIIQNLPSQRQTLLFSATQTKSVKDLARLSLKDPMYVSVHENAQHSTPTQLQQSYLVCDLQDKLSLLWSFIKFHLKTKILVFMSCCKQVRYVYEIFRRLRPGMSVMALHGSMQQFKRMEVYDSFCRKQSAVMFATDVAARGLDFPAVSWVMQLDCPEDANTYIHRAGRTARYEEGGEALLVLLPSEEPHMVELLQKKKIPINRIRTNPKKQRQIQGKIDDIIASDPELKEFAQRAFVSYLKSVFFMSNKKVFDVTALDTDAFARSLGLAIAPRVRFIEKEKKLHETEALEKKKKHVDKSKVKAPKSITKSTAGPETKSTAGPETKSTAGPEAKSTAGPETTAKKNIKKVQTVSKKVMGMTKLSSDGQELSSSESEGDSKADSEEGSDLDSVSDSEGDSDSGSDLSESDSDSAVFPSTSRPAGDKFGHDDDDDGDELFTIKKTSIVLDDHEIQDDPKSGRSKKKRQTKYAMAKKILKKNLKVNTKVEFDEEGEVVKDTRRHQQVSDEDDEPEGGININQARLRLAMEDKYDKEVYKRKVKDKHKEQKQRKKNRETEDTEGPDMFGVSLGRADDGSDPDDLPQPGSGSGSESGSGDEGWNSEEYSDLDDNSPPPRKRMRRPSASGSEQHSDQDDDMLGTVMSLADDEMLALKLLQS